MVWRCPESFFYMKMMQLTPYQGIKAWLFLMATVIVVVSIYNLIFQLLQWKWNIRFFAVIFILLGGFSAYFVNSLGIGISADQIQNALQTDQHEVLDLLSGNLFCGVLALSCCLYHC